MNNSELKTVSIDELVKEINRFEAIISEWDESQRCVVVGIQRAIEDLHREALTRLVKSIKQESIKALGQAVEDEIVYGVLLYHGLVKSPLQLRVQTALDRVRPRLQSHYGDVELVDIKLPDTVEVRLTGTCSHCSGSELTLSQLVQESVQDNCPEIKQVVAVR